MAPLDRHSPQLAGRYRPVGDSGYGSRLCLPGRGALCGRALLPEFEMKRERKPIFVDEIGLSAQTIRRPVPFDIGPVLRIHAH